MKTILHLADNRGHANYGWLKARYSFSFANYFDRNKMHFGVLRVLNDDTIAGGQGFNTHPHDNMEIITIPLEGDLEHKDNMGTQSVIRQGDVQVMSAGTGIYHSEFNYNPNKDLRLFQIWVFPNKRNVKPSYDQISIRDVEQENSFYQILSPYENDQGVWIHQDAWFSLGNFEKGKVGSYELKKSGNGVYLMVLDGKVEINGQQLGKRDAYGMWEMNRFELTAVQNSKVLLMDLPMQVS